MQTPDFPEDEVYRLEALKSLDLLDSQDEPDFDAVVHLGRALFGVPICLISLIDAERQWFKAKVGLDAPETPRDISFCGHAILGRDALVILNALEDPRFADNPLVTGPPNIRFYAGAPLRLPSGYSIGTLCLISPEPRADFTLEDRERLAHLAALAINVITVRALRAELDGERAALDRMAMALDLVDIPIALTDIEGRISRFNAAFETIALTDLIERASLVDALGLVEAMWSPEALAEREVEQETVTIDGGARVTIVVDGEGFVVTGERDD